MILLYKFRMVIIFTILPFAKKVYGDAVSFAKPISINFDFEDVPVDLIKSLYDKYKEAVADVSDIKQESMRRIFSKNKSYQIHVKRLKDVNGYKKHNLLIKEVSVSDNPFIYINNPIEAKFPNAYVTLDEFKHALTQRIKKQKDNLRKENNKVLLGNKFLRKGIETEVTKLHNKPTRTSSIPGSNGINVRSEKNMKITNIKTVQFKNKQRQKGEQQISKSTLLLRQRHPSKNKITKAKGQFKNRKTVNNLSNITPTIKSKFVNLETNREIVKSTKQIDEKPTPELNAASSDILTLTSVKTEVSTVKVIPLENISHQYTSKEILTESNVDNTSFNYSSETQVSIVSTPAVDRTDEDTTATPEIKESTLTTADTTAPVLINTDAQIENTTPTLEDPTTETTNIDIEASTEGTVQPSDSSTVITTTKHTRHTLGRPLVYMGS